MKRISLVLVWVVLLAALTAIPVLAQEGGHIYGIAFVDLDGNARGATTTGYVNDATGTWSAEPGVANVWVNFRSGGTHIRLGSAWTDNLSNPASTPLSAFAPDQQCTHLRDQNFGDGSTHWRVPQGCSGTFGLRPVPVGSWWEVWIEFPTNLYQYGRADGLGTSAAPFRIQALAVGSKAGWLEFPLRAITGDDNPPAAPRGRSVYINPRPAVAPMRTTIGAYTDVTAFR
jgi:hypothetical protein